jgi:hypothetical protein
MAEIDEKIKKYGIINNQHMIHFYKRYIDDIFIIWTGSKSQFEKFMKDINILHPTIKFTSEHNSKDKSTTYLDLTITIENDKIKTDLYRKETDKVQYLLPSSCHPYIHLRVYPIH